MATVPTDAVSTRLEALDILRGIALFGVMAINLVAAFRVSLFQRYSSDYLTEVPLDPALAVLLGIFVETKALTIFTILFGIGLAIQIERMGEPDKVKTLLIRRLAILLVIGLIHMLLIWPGRYPDVVRDCRADRARRSCSDPAVVLRTAQRFSPPSKSRSCWCGRCLKWTQE